MSDDLDFMEESPQAAFTKEDVEKAVEDWKNRLQAFFQPVQAWAEENGWKVDASFTVVMDEELMQEFGVPATEKPLLRLDRDDSYALFFPKSPWVIGANGRIDFYTSKGVYDIVDRAESGAAPRWIIFRASENREGDLFKPEMIANLV